MSEDPAGIITRLVDRTNAHDLDGLVACFADDYRLESPARPAAGFEGRGQVRQNWEAIFGAVPDIWVELLRMAVDGDTVWTEMEMRGRRRDGVPHLGRGPFIFGVRDGAIRWGRMYVTPVDESPVTIADMLPRPASTS